MRGGKLLLAWMGVFSLAIAGPARAAERRRLTDAELDKVTAGAGSAELVNGVVNFRFSSGAGSPKVESQGTITIKTEKPLDINVGMLVLQGSAQSNLRSLVNINAVNSRIQVLINLNVNINSSVARLVQTNSGGF